jgi:hypothetical protein
MIRDDDPGHALLTADHLAELAKSGIDAETARRAELRTIPSGTASDLLGWTRQTGTLGECLLIPYFGIDGKPIDYCQVKPTHPRVLKSKGDGAAKPIKYESPRDSANHLYFPPDARERLPDAAQPLLITEGAKKAIVAASLGYAALAVTGVWNWVRGGRPTDTTGRRVGRPQLIDDFSTFPLANRKVYIVFDSDAAEKESVRAAEKALATALRHAGASVAIVRLTGGPAGEKYGLDDYVVACGAESFAQLIAEADTSTECRQPVDRDADDRIPRITISTHEHQVNADARKALAADPDLYQRGGMLVRVVAADTDTPADKSIRVAAGTPEIVPLKRSLTREKLTQYAVWQREKVRGEDLELVPAHPPGWAVDAVHECGDWPDIRHLDAMTGYPIMLPSGDVAIDGYHDSCRLLVRKPRNLTITVPDRPTPGDVGDAVRILLDVVCDFPFADESHKSAWLAALLTPLAWQMFNGPAPLFLIDKNVRGAGAGLLGDTISLIVFGHPFATAVYTNNTEELAKTVTAIAMAGHPAVMFDNLSGKFGNAVIDQALTSSRWDGRILQESRHYRGPLNVVWYGTGNNVQLGADTPRRILPIRLETTEERPELRTGYRHADLRDYVRTHRGRLLSAAITILRAWHAAGRPTYGLPAWGSYEGWSGVVREAIVYAGLPDPGLARDAMMDTADTDAANMRTILTHWHHLDPTGHGITAADIVLRAKSVSLDPDPPEWIADIRDAIEDLCGRLDSRLLGYKFRHFARRNFGGLMLDKADPDRKNANRWTARPVGGRTHAGDQKPSPAPSKRRNTYPLVQLGKTTGTDAGDAGDDPGQPGFDLSFTSNPVRGIVGLDRKAVAQ